MLIMKPLVLPIPYEYGYAQPARGPIVYGRTKAYLDPQDPQHYARGEAGYYYDSQLGSPKRRLSTGAVQQANSSGPILRLLNGLRGLRDPVETSSAPATTEDVVALMNAHNDRLFALTVVSTTAVAVSAIITVFRTLKLIRQGKGD